MNAAMAALGPAGPLGGAIGARLAKTLPALAVAGAGGYVAHSATARLGAAASDADMPRPAHTEAVSGVLVPLPAFGIAGVGLVAASTSARGMRQYIDIGTNLDTGETVRLARQVRRGWTAGPRMLRAASWGAMAGAALAIGMLVPIVAAGGRLVGAGGAAAARTAMPDWLEGPAGVAARAPGDAVDAATRAGRTMLHGDEPELNRYGARIRVDTGPGFDPVRDLGLGQPGGTITVDGHEDTGARITERILDEAETRTGARPVPAE